MRSVLTNRACLAGVTLATGAVLALVATGATPAAAADTRIATSAPTSFQGTTDEYGIHLSALGGLPGLSSVPAGVDLTNGIELDLNHATGAVNHDATGKTADLANSSDVLLDGTLKQLADTGGAGSFVPSASSSLSNLGPNKAGGTLGLPDPLDLQIANAAAPDITATSVKAPLATSVTGAGLNASALSFASLLPAGSLSTFTTGYTALTGQITSLQTALATLKTATSALPLPDGTDPIGALSAALTQIQTEAQTAYDQVTTGALLDISGLQVSHQIETIGAQQVSTAHAELGKISLLGGLVTVDGFNNTVTAKAGGTPGSASFTPAVTNGGIGNVQIAGAGGGLSASGVTADLGPLGTLLNGLSGSSASITQSFTQALGDGFTTLVSSLNGLLTGIVQISADTPQSVKVAADGTSAAGALSGLEIQINNPTTAIPSLPALPALPGSADPTGILQSLPGLGDVPVGDIPVIGGILGGLTGALPGLADQSATANTATTPTTSVSAAATSATPLLDIALGSVSASAAARTATGVVAVTPSPTLPTSVKSLAFTGADLPVTGAIALALVLGGAYAARRRRSAADTEG